MRRRVYCNNICPHSSPSNSTFFHLTIQFFQKGNHMSHFVESLFAEERGGHSEMRRLQQEYRHCTAFSLRVSDTPEVLVVSGTVTAPPGTTSTAPADPTTHIGGMYLLAPRCHPHRPSWHHRSSSFSITYDPFSESWQLCDTSDPEFPNPLFRADATQDNTPHLQTWAPLTDPNASTLTETTLLYKLHSSEVEEHESSGIKMRAECAESARAAEVWEQRVNLLRRSYGIRYHPSEDNLKEKFSRGNLMEKVDLMRVFLSSPIMKRKLFFGILFQRIRRTILAARSIQRVFRKYLRLRDQAFTTVLSKWENEDRAERRRLTEVMRRSSHALSNQPDNIKRLTHIDGMKPGERRCAIVTLWWRKKRARSRHKIASPRSPSDSQSPEPHTPINHPAMGRRRSSVLFKEPSLIEKDVPLLSPTARTLNELHQVLVQLRGKWAQRRCARMTGAQSDIKRGTPDSWTLLWMDWEPSQSDVVNTRIQQEEELQKGEVGPALAKADLWDSSHQFRLTREAVHRVDSLSSIKRTNSTFSNRSGGGGGGGGGGSHSSFRNSFRSIPRNDSISSSHAEGDIEARIFPRQDSRRRSSFVGERMPRRRLSSSGADNEDTVRRLPSIRQSSQRRESVREEGGGGGGEGLSLEAIQHVPAPPRRPSLKRRQSNSSEVPPISSAMQRPRR